MESANRSLAEAFEQGARDRPDARLVVSSPARAADLRLAEVMNHGRIMGSHLVAMGIRPGDIIGVQLPAWSEWMVACIAIAHAGAVMLPIVSIYGPKELGFILGQSGAKMIVTPDRWRNFDYGRIVAESGPLPELSHHVVIGDTLPAGAIAWDSLLEPVGIVPAAPRAPDDLAMLVYTSGTTADPKGVMHSSRTLLSEMAAVAHARRNIPLESTLSPWPPGHVAGAVTMMRFIVQGIPLVLMDQWDPADAARLIEEFRVSACSFTPFHLAGLLDAADRDGRDLSSLVSCLVGAAPVPPSLIERCAARGLHTFRCYGSSEMPTVTTGDPSDPLEKRLTTEGYPMLGAEMRFVDDDGNDVPEGEDGELAVRGPELFTGYFDARLNNAAFLPGRWFRTGDIGRRDPDGFLLITDRKKDVIIRGGENISSREVEDLLFTHPEVADAAVVAAPDERMGEVVCAYVIPRSGATLTLDAIRAFFAGAGGARQKTPERLVLVDDLPRNSTGKVLKHELRARARAEGREGNRMSQLVTVGKTDGIALVTLNRPEAMNALSLALRSELYQAMTALDKDDEVAVVILTGAGDRAFTAGLDLKELGSTPGALGAANAEAARENPVRAIEACRKPVIGAINGVAITGGFEVALACDILIASTRARFADTHARVGVMPGWGLSQRLSRVIGIYRARELSLSGNFLDARTAEAWGLVNRVVEPEELLPAARRLAADIASADADMVVAYKRLINDGFALSFGDGMALEHEVSSKRNREVTPEDVERRRAAVQARGRAQ